MVTIGKITERKEFVYKPHHWSCLLENRSEVDNTIQQINSNDYFLCEILIFVHYGNRFYRIIPVLVQMVPDHWVMLCLIDAT